MTAEDHHIIELFENRSARGLARAISRAESGRASALIGALCARAGKAAILGITGPPGVGKSTLTGALIRVARNLRLRVGVISVDPSSPFSGGAILGDRIRLNEHFVDPGVFIRSMAGRGHLGGLSGAAGDAIMLMDAFGEELIIVETVGVGQSEVEIAELADTTLVVLQPGSGDSVQLLKAGVLEIADVFVVNKADHPGALQLQHEVRSMLGEIESPAAWKPPLMVTKAHEGDGILELWKAIQEHGTYLRESGELVRRRRRSFAHRVRSIVSARTRLAVDRALEQRFLAPFDLTESPYAFADRLLRDYSASA